MLPTPSTDHVSFDKVYEPSEDSYLLLDTLASESEKTFLRERFFRNGRRGDSLKETLLVTEIGPGSGVVLGFVSAHAKELLGSENIVTLGVDVNPFACKATNDTVVKACAEPNGGTRQISGTATFLDTVNGDLTSCLKKKSVDVLIFNPPYVPTESVPNIGTAFTSQNISSKEAEFEMDSQLLALSYAGGEDGMEVTNRLLDQIEGILTDRGIAYILLCAQNKPLEVIDRVKSWSPVWRASSVGSSGKTAGWEKLQIIRLWRDFEA